MEGTVELSEPPADIHLPVATHHPLVSKQHESVLGHISLYHGHRLWVYVLPEVDATHLHSTQRQWRDDVGTIDGLSV